MQGLKPLNKIGAAFGSYGWSGEAPKMITRALEGMNFQVIEPLRHQYIPDSDTLEASAELGRTVGRAINEQVSE
jgi:flavorubredoxin